MPAQGCELNYRVRTKSGEVFGQLTAACPHRGASNSFLRVTWTIRFGLSQGRDSSQQHVRTGGGFKFSPTFELDYLGFGLSQVRLYDLIRTAHSSMPTQGESDSLLRVR